MAIPRLPSGLRLVAQGYSIGSPDGVGQTALGGGSPRSALLWDRGTQGFQCSMLLTEDEFAVWTLWFIHVIKKGAYRFILPLNSGLGVTDHVGLMAQGTYSAVPAGGPLWSVSFAVLAEPSAYAYSKADADAFLAIWEAYGPDSSNTFDRLAQFANVDTLVLQL